MDLLNQGTDEGANVSKLAFMRVSQLKKNMEVAVLAPKCVRCGLWQLVVRGKITELESGSTTTVVMIGRERYSLGYATAREVVLAGQESHWLGLSKVILCSHS